MKKTMQRDAYMRRDGLLILPVSMTEQMTYRYNRHKPQNKNNNTSAGRGIFSTISQAPSMWVQQAFVNYSTHSVHGKISLVAYVSQNRHGVFLPQY